MHFSAPISIDDVARTISDVLGVNGGSYEKCVCPDGTIEIKEPGLLSPQSCIGRILCLKGTDGKEGPDMYMTFEVDFNWSHPVNMPVLKKTDEYGLLVKEVEKSLFCESYQHIKNFRDRVKEKHKNLFKPTPA